MALDTSILSQLADGMVAAYQRYVSPHKGFRCAHRALHGRSSCSQFARRLLQRRGLGGLAPLLEKRFQRCRRAAQSLMTRRRNVLDYERKQPQQPDRRKKDPTTWGDCASHPVDCIPLDCGSPDASACDGGVSACDGISAIDGCACDLTP